MSEKKYPIIERNAAGKEIYREEANGFWVKRAYDEQGRQIYWETPHSWAKHEFDEAGNETYYENDSGFWFKVEYNENGFRTYYEDSEGKVIGKKSIDKTIASAVERSEATVNSDAKPVDFVKE